ncbi:MAG: hypothetical protein ACK4QL_09430 [Pseudanabaenaceae cyanobacterium]
MEDWHKLRSVIREAVHQAIQDSLPEILEYLLSRVEITPKAQVASAPEAPATTDPDPVTPELEAEVMELLAQREALIAELSAIDQTATSQDQGQDIDQLLNSFADAIEAEITAPPEPEPQPDFGYSPRNTWFLGVDIYCDRLSLCLADGDTGQTYPLQFSSTQGDRLSYRQLDGEWQMGTNLASKLSQTSQNLLSEQLQALWQSLIGELRHPNLPVADLPTIFQNLQGIVVSQPYGESDAYGIRCRQTLLEVGWIKAPESVLVIERALGPLLAIAHQGPDFQFAHLCLQVFPDQMALSLLAKPPRITHLEVGVDGLQQGIARLLFSHLDDPETGFYFYRTCSQAFSRDPLLSQWEYEWQHQSAYIHRQQWEQAQQQALQTWVQPLSAQLNQMLSYIADPNQLDLWLVGHIPSLLTEWLCAKLIPAHLHHLPETAIAQGLALAPFYREYLDVGRLQYSDYFLLHELCHLRLPDPCDPDLIFQTLHNRGVNVRACEERLRGLLFQGLPPKLGLASDLDGGAVLFQATGDGKLSACRDVMVILRSHLQQFQYGLRQNLAEPLVFPHYRCHALLSRPNLGASPPSQV